jgi:hypothetical protein
MTKSPHSLLLSKDVNQLQVNRIKVSGLIEANAQIRGQWASATGFEKLSHVWLWLHACEAGLVGGSPQAPFRVPVIGQGK